MGQCCSIESSADIEEDEQQRRQPPERMTSSSFGSLQGNLVLEKHVDYHSYYDVVEVIGQGSISNISKIQRKKRTAHSTVEAPKQPGIKKRVKSLSGRIVQQMAASFKSSSAPGRKKPEYYALKEIDLSLLKPEYTAELRNEIALLKSLDHPNIIKIYETFKVRKRLAVVMELMEGGDLYTRYPYTEAQAATVVQQILSAVAYLHSRHVIHRDIKFENIMYESKDTTVVKLIDFGLARVYFHRKLTAYCGTMYTMAPEVIRQEYTSKADLWSVGVVSFMLMSGEKPFWSRVRSELISQIVTARYSFHGQHWKVISKEGKAFIRALLVINPDVRLSARQALQHRWLSANRQWSQEKPDLDALREAKANLARYAESSEFKKVALMVIARQSTPSDIFELRKIFAEIDTENTGTVTYKGFRKALEELYPENEIREMFDKIDLDRSGFIEYTEFLAATLEAQGRIEEYRMAEAFERLDSDNQGYISKENLCKILGREYSDPASDDYVDRLISEIDEDRDGKISYEDFKHAMSRAVDNNVKQMVEECESLATTASA